MWFSYSIANHQYQVQGMYEQRLGQRVLCFSNDAARLNDIRDLADSEYQQAVELDQMRRKVSFGRDYLGHYPLFYAQTGDDIVISDDVHLIKDWLAARHIEVTISSHAIGFYLSMGYVPQGYTLFNEIHSCRNATLYHWENGKVTEQNLFSAVEIDSSCHIDDVASELNTELDKLFKQNQELDVWCSGGLDSAIIAMLCNQGERKADLLTLKHASDFRGQFGEGELPYAQSLQRHLNTGLRTVEFSLAEFTSSYYDFINLHPTPVIDPVVTPKYMLASKTRALGITGEGGDPIFSGIKNNTVSYMHDKHPELDFGTIYALAHLRLYAQIERIMVDGDNMRQLVSHNLQSLWDRYPGDITRKLFYMNTFEKQGGMIFPKNYYAAKHGKVSIRHPMASLGVYQAAFALDDKLKYRYPTGKLALIDLYGKRLPESIVNRKKSGTLVPLNDFIKNIHIGKYEFDSLLNTGLFNEEFVMSFQKNDIADMDNSSVFMLYAILSLNKWLESNVNGGGNNAKRNLSTGAGNL